MQMDNRPMHPVPLVGDLMDNTMNSSQMNQDHLLDAMSPVVRMSLYGNIDQPTEGMYMGNEVDGEFTPQLHPPGGSKRESQFNSQRFINNIENGQVSPSFQNHWMNL